MPLNQREDTPIDGVLHALSGKGRETEKSNEADPETLRERLKNGEQESKKENESSEARTSENESASDSDQEAIGDDHREDEKSDLEAQSDENSQENEGDHQENESSSSEEGDEEEQENNEKEMQSDVAEAVKLADIAKELDVDPGDLYDVEIPLGGDGETMTLGAMKDQIQEFAPKMEKLKNIELEQIQVRSERVKNHQELESLIVHLPDAALSPDYVAAVKEQAVALAKEQSEKLLVLMPEWGDSLTYQKDFGGMVNTLKKYGLAAADLNNIQDHRYIKILHDYTTLVSRKSEAKRLAKTLPKSPSKRGKTNVKAVKAQAKGKLAEKLRERAKGGDKQAQRELVGSLIS